MNKLVSNIQEEKNRISTAIMNVIKEIFNTRKSQVITEKNISKFKNEIGTFMDILKSKNKIYDYVIIGEYNLLSNCFEFEIVYSLIDIDDAKYQDYLKFELR